MGSTTLHLLDLPDDIINEILLKCDLETLDNIEKTCTALRDRVTHFRKTHEDHIARKMDERKYRFIVAGDEDSDDYEDYDDHELGAGDDLDDIQQFADDFYDRLSWGSNYDEEIDDFINQQ